MEFLLEEFPVLLREGIEGSLFPSKNGCFWGKKKRFCLMKAQNESSLFLVTAMSVGGQVMFSIKDVVVNIGGLVHIRKLKYPPFIVAVVGFSQTFFF